MGVRTFEILEQVHLIFCERILKVRFTSPNYMVYGGLGRFPLEIIIKIRMASFWINMIYGDKLNSCMYKLLFRLKQNGVHTSKWLNFIESILNDTEMGYVFANQDDYDYKLLLKQSLQDQFIQKWYHEIQFSLEENLIRVGSFNYQGGGGVCFFLKKIF